MTAAGNPSTTAPPAPAAPGPAAAATPAAAPAAPPPARGRLRRAFEDPQRRRLEESIRLLRRQYRYRGANLAPGDDRSWLDAGWACLEDAEEAARAGQVDEGWAYVHRARELEVLGYDETDVAAAAIELASEAGARGKLNRWRSGAVLALLAGVAEQANGVFSRSLPARRRCLQAAIRIRNEGLANEFRSLAILRRHQRLLLAAGGPLVLAVVVLLAARSTRFDDPRGLSQAWVSIACALVGALGAIASALQRSTRARDRARIPEQLGAVASSLVRPVIGAVAGLTVWLAGRAGIALPAEHEVAYVLLGAFGAGFTERLIVRTPDDGGAAPGASPPTLRGEVEALVAGSAAPAAPTPAGTGADGAGTADGPAAPAGD